MPTNDPTPPVAASPSLLKQTLIVLLALGIGAVLAVGAYLYWHYEAERPSTDDAYLQAHYVWIGPRVDGQVSEVLVRDHQWVDAGQPLFRIDSVPFELALTRAKSAAALVRQDIEVQRAAVTVAEARVREQQALLNNAKETFERVSALAERGDEPKLRGIEVKDQYDAARATLDDLQAELELARQTLGPASVQQARLDKAAAAVDLARLHLDWTRVVAPAQGWISRLTLRPGDQVSVGDKLFTLVEAGDWWVEANYKETDVAGIRAGMPARVRIDSVPGRVFPGRVASVGAASAAAFSLLPAQNTTGNWVKVTQRIPVRIALGPMDPTAPYRLGASTSVSIDLDATVSDPQAPGPPAAGAAPADGPDAGGDRAGPQTRP